MTVQDIIQWFENYPFLIIGYFTILIFISLLGLAMVNRRNFKSPITLLYSLLVYAVTIPGLLALIITAYSFLFLKTNLLEINILAYFVPIIAMIIVLFIINKTVPMHLIPGFGKLSGLFVIIAITFIITYVLQKMFFGVFFVGRIQYLLLFFLALLFILRIAWKKITK
ncbi:hypothetical protein ACSTS3_07415 [Aquimarina muelleri]|uniref:hypothetical protein n=1 Tax=Aquimarina muelleri TaxID=279356 RepID=UPI003F686D46